MSWIDFILNAVGLLLWLNWRAIHLSPVARSGSSLVATLKPASPPRARWLYLVLLAALLFVRAIIYYQLGSALQWVPSIPLGPTTLTFRSDVFQRILLYSVFSFGAALLIFYLWLLVLSWVNSNLPENDPQHRFVQLHLGYLEFLPSVLKLLPPFVVSIALWCLLNPLLANMQMMPRTGTWHLVEQGAMIGLAMFVSLKYLLIGLLTLHLISSYVYLGEYSFLNYVDASARNFLRPFRALPLRIGKIDLLPLLVLILLFVLPGIFNWACGRLGINFSHLFQRLSS